MTPAATPHPLAHDALAVLTGLTLLGFAACLFAFAFWLRWEVTIWQALS